MDPMPEEAKRSKRKASTKEMFPLQQVHACFLDPWASPVSKLWRIGK